MVEKTIKGQYYGTPGDLFTPISYNCFINHNSFIDTFHARIQEFSSGGVQVSLKKKLWQRFFFFSPQLTLQKSNGQFQRNLSISRFQRGSNIFKGGSNFFEGGPIAYSLLKPI